MPPIPPAVHAMPVASARRFKNQWPIVAMAGVNWHDAEIPPNKPKVRRNW